MSRFGTQLICLSLLVVLLAPAGAEAGKKRKRGPAVAVWDVFVEDDNRAEAWHWYGRISEAIDSLEQLRADDDLDFSPAARPSEGIVVAGTTAVRWLDAAWVAFRGREYVVAISFAEDALGLIEGYPAARMPDGLVRDLELMIARCQVVQGRTGPARSSMRAASLLDPAWEARPGWESREFVDLWQEVAAERSSAPPATLVVETDEPFSRILLYGVDQGGTAGGGALELQLPPGIYEVTARKPGYADRSERVHLKPHDLVEVAFDLEVENSPAFQESLLEALRTPADQ